MATIVKTMVIGGAAGGGAGYAWARKQGQEGTGALMSAGKGAAVGATGGGVTGAGLALRRRRRTRRSRPQGLGLVVELARSVPARAAEAADTLSGHVQGAVGAAPEVLERAGDEVGRRRRAATGATRKAGKKMEKEARKLEKEARKRMAKGRKQMAEGRKRAEKAADKAAEKAAARTRKVAAKVEAASSRAARKGQVPAHLAELRSALDDAIASGRPVPADKPLVTRLI
ncbi:MAG: hypothetical protein ACRDY7_07960 [Acidimicrobiia bacterium]